MPSRFDPLAFVDKLSTAGLTGTVGIREVREYYRRARVPASRQGWVIGLIVCAYLIGQAVFLYVFMPATALDPALLRAVFVGFMAFTSVYGALLLGLIRRNVTRQVRLERTARANGMGYNDRLPLAMFTGSAFTAVSRLEATDIIRAEPSSVSPVGFTAGTFRVRPELLVKRAGFAQISLERPTPHIVLENRRSKVLRSTGERFIRGQRMRLEGDFDRTFSLYCPAGYERDALYIFTPDLMAVLLDLAGDCEVELIDGSLLLYSGRPWKLWRPDRLLALHRVVQLVGAKAQGRTHLYRDDRSDGSGIAPAGRRLRHRPTLGTVLAMASPIAIGLLSVVGFIAGLS